MPVTRFPRHTLLSYPHFSPTRTFFELLYEGVYMRLVPGDAVDSLGAQPLLLDEADALLDEAGHEVLVRLRHVLQEADARLALRGQRPPVLPLTLLGQRLQSLLLQ